MPFRHAATNDNCQLNVPYVVYLPQSVFQLGSAQRQWPWQPKVTTIGTYYHFFLPEGAFTFQHSQHQLDQASLNCPWGAVETSTGGNSQVWSWQTRRPCRGHSQIRASGSSRPSTRRLTLLNDRLRCCHGPASKLTLSYMASLATWNTMNHVSTA